MAGGWTRPSWLSRRRAIGLGVAVSLVVAAVATIVVVSGDEPPGTKVSVLGSDEPTTEVTDATAEPATSSTTETTATETTGTTSTTPTTSTTAKAATNTTARTIATDAKGGWTLRLTTSDRGTCLELLISTYTSGPLLCGSGPAADHKIVGDLVTFETPNGRTVVAIVEPRIESWGVTPYQVGFVPTVHDRLPGRSAFAYAVGDGRNPLNSGSKLFFGIGENVVAKTRFAMVDGTIPPGQSLTTTDKPYGLWSGYRRAGTTGYYWGGNEEFGFYDGDGGRCLLYRRIDGDPESMLFDICAPTRDGQGVAYAKLLPIPAEMKTTGGSGRNLVVLFDGPKVAAWQCTFGAGQSCGRFGSSGQSPGFGRAAQLAIDPSGSGRQVIGTFPEPLPTYGDSPSVTIWMYDAAGAEITHVDIPTT